MNVSVDPADLMSTDAHIYDLNDDAKASIDSRYHDIVGATPQETKMLRIRQNLIDRGDLTVGQDGSLQTGVSEKTKPEFKPNYAPDKFYAHYDYRLANPAGGPQVPNTPQPMTIPYAGTGVVHAPNYVPVSLPSKNFAGATGINLQTGKPEKSLGSSDDYSIVGGRLSGIESDRASAAAA